MEEDVFERVIFPDSSLFGYTVDSKETLTNLDTRERECCRETHREDSEERPRWMPRNGEGVCHKDGLEIDRIRGHGLHAHLQELGCKSFVSVAIFLTKRENQDEQSYLEMPTARQERCQEAILPGTVVQQRHARAFDRGGDRRFASVLNHVALRLLAWVFAEDPHTDNHGGRESDRRRVGSASRDEHGHWRCEVAGFEHQQTVAGEAAQLASTASAAC
jgi:hypothetical protein